MEKKARGRPKKYETEEERKYHKKIKTISSNNKKRLERKINISDTDSDSDNDSESDEEDGYGIDFKDIKWGALTKQAKAKKMSLEKFAHYVIHHKNEFRPITLKRVEFYLNVILKKQNDNIISSNNKMPHFKKGSPEAKAHMAKIRNMKGSKKGGTLTGSVSNLFNTTAINAIKRELAITLPLGWPLLQERYTKKQLAQILFNEGYRAGNDDLEDLLNELEENATNEEEEGSEEEDNMSDLTEEGGTLTGSISNLFNTTAINAIKQELVNIFNDPHYNDEYNAIRNQYPTNKSLAIQLYRDGYRANNPDLIHRLNTWEFELGHWDVNNGDTAEDSEEKEGNGIRGSRSKTHLGKKNYITKKGFKYHHINHHLVGNNPYGGAIRLSTTSLMKVPQSKYNGVVNVGTSFGGSIFESPMLNQSFQRYKGQIAGSKLGATGNSFKDIMSM